MAASWLTGIQGALIEVLDYNQGMVTDADITMLLDLAASVDPARGRAVIVELGLWEQHCLSDPECYAFVPSEEAVPQHEADCVKKRIVVATGTWELEEVVDMIQLDQSKLALDVILTLLGAWGLAPVLETTDIDLQS